jgi:C4-dicarboxylate-specific signal transduction histidine kinase
LPLREAPTTTTVDLNEICRQAVHLLQRDAVLRRTRLELALEPHAVSVSGDPVQLQQVVLNLALNALDSASSSTDDPAVTVSTVLHDGEVEISVRDTGPGLHPTYRATCSNRFLDEEAGAGGWAW